MNVEQACPQSNLEPAVCRLTVYAIAVEVLHGQARPFTGGGIAICVARVLDVYHHGSAASFPSFLRKVRQLRLAMKSFDRERDCLRASFANSSRASDSRFNRFT